MNVRIDVDAALARLRGLRDGTWVTQPPPRRKAHGMTGTPTYFTWNSMKGRCYHPATRSYEYYGGRGITVCERWREPNEGFRNFLADMGERPEGKTLDRINPDGNYEPGNCRWATRREQQANRRPRASLAPVSRH